METIRTLDRKADFQSSHRNPDLIRFLLAYEKNYNR